MRYKDTRQTDVKCVVEGVNECFIQDGGGAE